MRDSLPFTNLSIFPLCLRMIRPLNRMEKTKNVYVYVCVCVSRYVYVCLCVSMCVHLCVIG